MVLATQFLGQVVGNQEKAAVVRPAHHVCAVAAAQLPVLRFNFTPGLSPRERSFPEIYGAVLVQVETFVRFRLTLFLFGEQRANVCLKI